MRSTFFLLLTVCTGYSQSFLNGSFEINSAGLLDKINNKDSVFNNLMKDVVAFGTSGNVDIIKSSQWGGGGAKNCLWYVALTAGGTDAIALKLSGPLTTGVTYTMSFWDRKDTGFSANNIQIGLSTASNAIGSVIYTTPGAPTDHLWVNRTFTFVAPNSGSFVTVRQGGAPNLAPWVHVDHFSFGNSPPTPSVYISATSKSVCAGSSVTLTAGGANSYSWSPSSNLSSPTATTVISTPAVSTVYTLTAMAGNCKMQTNITINVLPELMLTVWPSPTICAGRTVTFTASGATSYTWLPLNTTGYTAVDTPSATTIYTILTDDPSGCKAVWHSTVQVKSMPSVKTLVNSTIMCVGDHNVIIAQGAATYTWMPGNIMGSLIPVNTGSAGSFTYAVTGSNGEGCAATTSLTINVALCESVGEWYNAALSIQPNPSHGEFTVSSERDLQLNIYSSIGGVLVKQVQITEGLRRVTVEGLAPGVYYITDQDQRLLKKAVVLR